MTEQSKTTNHPDYSTESIVDLSIRQSKARLTPSAVDGFVAIMKAWKIGDEDASGLLGGISPERYAAMREVAFHEVLSEETLIRISYLIGIFQALHTLLEGELADSWMSCPNDNSMFRGTTPLAYCLEHGILGLKNVRNLLDARCQGY